MGSKQHIEHRGIMLHIHLQSTIGGSGKPPRITTLRSQSVKPSVTRSSAPVHTTPQRSTRLSQMGMIRKPFATLVERYYDDETSDFDPQP